MKFVKPEILMVFITICWGSSYLFMKLGLDSLDAFNLIALRFGLAFIIVAFLFIKRLKQVNVKTVQFGMLLGFLLFLVFTFITYGLKSTTTSNAGFLVSLTVVFVPILSSFLLKKKIESKLITSIVLAIIGIALLTIKLPFTIHIGDLLCISAALAYAFHITVADYASKKVDTLNLGIMQLGFAAFYGMIFSFIYEKPTLPSTFNGWFAILALSIVCSALGFTLQIVAQKYISAAKTGLIFSLEPVFAALFGILFAGESIAFIGYIGAAFVLSSIIISSLKKTADITTSLSIDR